jgi:hypothetical protein
MKQDCISSRGCRATRRAVEILETFQLPSSVPPRILWDCVVWDHVAASLQAEDEVGVSQKHLLDVHVRQQAPRVAHGALEAVDGQH